MFDKIKFEIFKKPLELTKTHDYCASKKPRLTVVLIHGIAADSSSFRRALEYLEGTRSLADVRFVSFDLLGAGKSYKSNKLNYDFKEQLEALENSIKQLKTDLPIVLVGHSMGALIATRFSDSHRRMVKELILISPPVFREKDMEKTLFKQSLNAFRGITKRRSPMVFKEKAFEAELQNMVLDSRNYEYLVAISQPTTLIYGMADEIIGKSNISELLKKNQKINAIKTPGAHGMSRDKYGKILMVLERILNETI